jgi:hypothetical protein
MRATRRILSRAFVRYLTPPLLAPFKASLVHLSRPHLFKPVLYMSLECNSGTFTKHVAEQSLLAVRVESELGITGF